MDPVLPFRALSPRTRSPKIIHQRNRDTKLSLKSRKVGTGGKENEAPLTERNFKQPNFRLGESELITSDESDSSDIDVGTYHRQSVMSLNTQESTFSLPVAESTRCELPARNKLARAESTTVTLHTARNSSSSSTGTEYHTAYPFPVGCDESIVCISDSSPESVKKNIKISSSALLTSDESDSELPTKSTNKSIFSSIPKFNKKKLCDTVVIESSDEEDSSISSRGNNHCDIVVPPSVKSNKSSCSSLASSTCSRLRIEDGHVIPPSPENCAEASDSGSLLSEDHVENHSDVQKTDKFRGKVNPSCPDLGKKKQCNSDIDKILSQKSPNEPDLTTSSWKDDFHLVMEETTASVKDKSICTDKIPKASSQNKVTGSISKEKYNDIARWLISGRSTESDSDGSTSCEKRLSKKQVDNPSDKVCSPQVDRLPARNRYSSGSESDDNFEALMASIRKKRNEDLKKSCVKKSSNDDSFIVDGIASDEIDSPAMNVYHSDLTRSIKAEVKSVKKSVKSVTKKKLFGYDDEIEDKLNPSVEGKQKNISKKPLDSSRKTGPLKGDSVKSKPSKNGKYQETDSDTSDSEYAPPSKGKASVNRKTKLKKTVKRFNSIESSDSEDSSSDKFDEPKTPLWRNNRAVSGSGSDCSGSTSSSKSDLPKPKPKEAPKINTIVPKSVQQLKTPKNIATLKSPQTPFSPIRTFLSSLSGPTHEPGVRDHPEAVVYNKNFKGKKEELTRRLFKLFNREVFDRRLPDDMVLEWNSRLVRTAGLCYCKLVRKAGVTSRTTKIDLSTKVITSPDRLRDTLIHEMCHAAVWLLNNVSGGHGPFWKAWAHKAMKRFPELPPIERCHSYNIETKYTYKCTKCGYSFGRHSKSLDLNKKRCGYCYGTFEVFLSSKGTPNNKESSLKTPKAPSAFALFVKENYGLVKQDHSDFKHGDIMKKLGEKFAEMKVKQSAS